MPTTITPKESAAIRREMVMELWKKFVQAVRDVDEILGIFKATGTANKTFNSATIQEVMSLIGNLPEPHDPFDEVRHNDGPDIETCEELATQHPQTRFSGYIWETPSGTPNGLYVTDILVPDLTADECLDMYREYQNDEPSHTKQPDGLYTYTGGWDKEDFLKNVQPD